MRLREKICKEGNQRKQIDKKYDKERVELERRDQLKKQMGNYTNLNDCKWSKIIGVI